MRTWIPLLIAVILALGEGFATAQQTGKVPRIGVLGLAYPSSPFLESFRQGLRELGYVEGRDISLYPRSSPELSRLDEFAAEMVRLQVDVIVAQSTLATYAAMSATKTIPIVMASTGDPVASEMVASLERPGGNVTGVSGLPTGLGGKMLELLKDTVPGVSRVAVLWNEGPEKIAPAWKAMRKGVEVAARSLGVELQALEVRRPGDLAGAFRSVASSRADAFIALPGGFGTFEELLEMITWGQLGRHRKPVGLLNVSVTSGLPSSFPRPRWPSRVSVRIRSNCSRFASVPSTACCRSAFTFSAGALNLPAPL